MLDQIQGYVIYFFTCEAKLSPLLLYIYIFCIINLIFHYFSSKFNTFSVMA